MKVRFLPLYIWVCGHTLTVNGQFRFKPLSMHPANGILTATLNELQFRFCARASALPFAAPKFKGRRLSHLDRAHLLDWLEPMWKRYWTENPLLRDQAARRQRCARSLPFSQPASPSQGGALDRRSGL